MDKDLLVAGSLGHFDRKCASFPAVISELEYHDVVFSRHGKNNWCLGRIFVYHVDSAFQ